MTTTTADAIRPAIPGLSLRHYRRGDGAALGRAGERATTPPTGSTGARPARRRRTGTRARRPLRRVARRVRGRARRPDRGRDERRARRHHRRAARVPHRLHRRIPACAAAGSAAGCMRLSEEAAARACASEPTELTPVLGTWCPELAHGRLALIEQEGYQAVRYFFDMVRPNLDGIVLPADARRPRGAAGAADRSSGSCGTADVEAFRDHWGGFDGDRRALRGMAAATRSSTRACTSSPGTATRSPAA